MSQGCETMIEVGRQLRRRTNGTVWLEVIGEAAETEAREALQGALQKPAIYAGSASCEARRRWLESPAH
jgi:hypothetical protein